jgi:transcription elongation factor Elf1
MEKICDTACVGIRERGESGYATQIQDRGRQLSMRLWSCPMTATESRRLMSKETDRANLERLVREAMEKKAVAVKKGDTRMEPKCGKCGAPNRVKVAPGTSRTTFKCKECGHQQSTL